MTGRATGRVLTGRAKEAAMTVADLLVLSPWLVFAAGLAVIGYRLLGHRGRSRSR